MGTLIRSILFTIIVPGSVAGWIPVMIGGGFDAVPPFGVVQWAALPLLAIGAALLLWPIWDFTFAGQGTPNPLDPPRRLVVRGVYRHMRNPMYTGALLMNLGWALLFESRNVALYAVGVWVLHFLFVVLYEEPKLRSLFGEEYEAYRRATGRWLPL